jgi:hypothetical protein
MVLSLSRKIRKVKDLSKVGWFKLKPRDRSIRILALKVLDLMRDKVSLTKACKEVGLNIEIVKQHIRSAIYKRKGRWRAKRFDKIQREMNIYERGRIKSIVVANSKDASLIGRYYNDVKKALETNDERILRKYKGRIIKDAKGKKHTLETRLEKIFEIEEAKEEPEFWEIYEV